MTRSALQSRLFQDEAEARDIAAHLLAGVPEHVPLTVRWDRPDPSKVEMTAVSRDRQDGVAVVRTFVRQGRRPWRVEHALFVLDERHRGGAARRMLRASLEIYDRMGVPRIDIFADIDLGGYVWARLGFAASLPSDVRAGLARAAQADPGSDLFREAHRVARASEDDDLMEALAALTVDGDGTCGKLLLAGTKWLGHADLTDPRHRARIARHLAPETETTTSDTTGGDHHERA